MKSGKLTTLGIVQEQHPDRAALYMQWQKMDWPVLADPFNRLGVKVVAITMLVDESGIIRYKNPSPKDFVKFMASSYPKQTLKRIDDSFDGSLATLEAALKKSPKDPMAYFRLGVALRQRFDSIDRQKGDFGQAIVSWQKALELQPDQYIWRRRIQQYGPRLDKPYSFYDWVNEARKDLGERGEKPHPLTAEPRGSEFAYPEKKKDGGGLSKQPKHPDPAGKVPSDTGVLLQSSAVVVPSTKGDGKAVRVHLRFHPTAQKEVHWTNEAGNIEFHFDSNEGFEIHDYQGAAAPPAVATSAEVRGIEFELRPARGKKLPAKIGGTAYYYVCEGEEGVCRFLKQKITLEINR